ncbi:putative M18 family aminopeptidase 1 [uncultured Desulfatiglans sp.]|nr:putative M18 family aminopeptidase 1 [uncultured Desulfatiglans sp.]
MEEKRPDKEEMARLQDKLVYQPALVWDAIGFEEREAVFRFADAYKPFLDASKTEREAVETIRRLALENGFAEAPGSGGGKAPFFRSRRGKWAAVVRPGSAPLSEGLRVIVSHTDSPRLDLKQRPVYEEADLAFLKTHYYGGIKKYQWLARPLAIHGRILRADGSWLDLAMGEKPDDPVFSVLDLLPHLAAKSQYEKKLGEAIEGEKLNVIAGALPLGDDETKDRFKLALLAHLNETLGLLEEDFISAEIEVVPAGPARDVGWDRAMVGAYGQDDRACVYTSLRAVLDMVPSEKSALVLFVDKEEIGSEGATSARSKFLEAVVGDCLEAAGEDATARAVGRVLAASEALSADVAGALDPDYQDVHEKRNAARLGYGPCFVKFTGHRGKVGANDADAEYLGWLRRVFKRGRIVWQTGELGKVDEGGGGTAAKYLAVHGVKIVDCGPPILSMHSPFEITHKGDLYMTYRAYRAFLECGTGV